MSANSFNAVQPNFVMLGSPDVYAQSNRINKAIETAKSAANLCLTYQNPHSQRAIRDVEMFLNENCPRNFISLALGIFNQECRGIVKAFRIACADQPIRLVAAGPEGE